MNILRKFSSGLLLMGILLLLPVSGMAQDPAGGSNEIEQLRDQAATLYDENDLDGALNLYRQLAERQEAPHEKAGTMVMMAWLEHLLDRNSAAFSTLVEALVLDPHVEFQSELFDSRLRDLFLEAQVEAERQRDQNSYEAFSRGLAQMRARDYAAARAAFLEAISIRRDHPQAIYNLAIVDLYENRGREALDGFQKFLSLAPANPEAIGPKLRSQALTNVGLIYSQREEFTAAEEALKEAVEHDPQNDAAWTDLGITRRLLGQKVNAVAALVRAHELQSDHVSSSQGDSARVIHHLALAYFDLEDWNAAATLLRDATQRLAADPGLWTDLGDAEAALHNDAAAIRAYDAAIESDPNNASGYGSAAAIRRADLQLRTGDPDGALRAAERALQWNQEDVDGWIFRGMAQHRMRDLDNARQSLEEARRLDPSRPHAHNNLGNVYYELGLYDQAEQAFQQALAQKPDFSAARDNLAAVQEVKGHGQAQRAPVPGARKAPSRPPIALPPASPPPAARPPPPNPPPPSPPPPAQRLRLGIRFSEIDYSTVGIQGVGIQSVVTGTLASRAGLRPEDLILKVDGQTVTSPDFLEIYIRDCREKRVLLDILREAAPMRVEMRLD